MAKAGRRKNHDHDDEMDGMPFMPEMPDLDGPIWVNQFNEDSARAFTKQVQYQSRQDPTAPIIVYIDSYGGEVYSLLTMLSALDSVPNPIVTVALAKAMSAGAVLLAYGDKRYASPHASLMIHEMSAGAAGHIDDIQVQHDNLSKLNEYIMKILADCCNIKGGYPALKKTIAKVRDMYLSAEEAIKFGLIDEIGVPRLSRSISVDYTVSTNPRGKKNGSPNKA